MTLLTAARAIDRFTDRVGRATSWFTLAMVLVGVWVVMFRYAFSIVFVWLQESMTYMHSAVFLIGAAYAMLYDGHARVDILYKRMTPKSRAIVGLVGTVLFVLPLSAVVFFGSYRYVLNSWDMLERSQHMRGIPAVFLLKTLIWVFAGGIALQGISAVIRNTLTLIGASAATGEPLDLPMSDETPPSVELL